jgi:hypothetical protein
MQRDLGISLGCGIGGALASDRLGSNFKLGLGHRACSKVQLAAAADGLVLGVQQDRPSDIWLADADMQECPACGCFGKERHNTHSLWQETRRPSLDCNASTVNH